MTQEARSIIQLFEHLSDTEKKEVMREILHRSLKLDFPPMTDDELVQNADDLFLELDKRESSNG